MKKIDRRKFIGSCISVYGLAGFNDIIYGKKLKRK